MSTASPTAYLLWSILSVLFLGFLIYHLWSYDKFKCLAWSAGRQPGAFKRVMTYSYLSSVPLFTLYSIATTVIKFQEGYIMTPEHKIFPRPLDTYPPHSKAWIIPLNFVFSIAWALELVTHLEELAFWLYLLHQKPEKESWFSSWEYRLWYLGSMVAIIGMPLTALVTRQNVITCDAYIFLVGAAGSTCTTICFLYVLWRFPRFIKHVKSEGADPTVVVRLATFYQLNLARVVFRFLFTVPLVVLALDGIIGEVHHINRDPFWTDFLFMIGGIGCFVSTTITLLIFFPRSIIKEAGYRPKAPSTIATSPKSFTTSPPISMMGAPTPFPTGIQRQSISMITSPVSPAFPEGEEWDDDASMTGTEESGEAVDGDEAPPYAVQQSSYFPQAPHSQVPATHPSILQLQAESQSPPVQFQHHTEQNSTTYQRHTFPHSLSSPQIFPVPPPSSPINTTPPTPIQLTPPHSHALDSQQQQQQLVNHVSIPMPTSSRPGHHRRRSSRRVSVAADALQTPAEHRRGSVRLGLGVGTMGNNQHYNESIQTSVTRVNRPSRLSDRELQASSNLHPYVMTFTSPIDLVEIPPREPYPRTST